MKRTSRLAALLTGIIVAMSAGVATASACEKKRAHHHAYVKVKRSKRPIAQKKRRARRATKRARIKRYGRSKHTVWTGRKFARADLNRDGRISRVEAMHAMLRAKHKRATKTKRTRSYRW